MNGQQIAHLKSIVNTITAAAPGVATHQTRLNVYEGEEQFDVEYDNFIFTCVRRVGYLDTSNLDYYNGTGYDCDVIYDEIAVLEAWNTTTEEDDDSIVYDLNERLFS